MKSTIKTMNQALSDIKKDIPSHITYHNGDPESWTVGVSKLNTKRNRILNKLLTLD